MGKNKKGKNKQEKNEQANHNTSAKSNNQKSTGINLLTHLKDYKEAYALIGVFLSAVLTATWNILCKAGYLGYYTYWDIPTKYYINDTQNVLVTFLITIGFITFFSIPIYMYAKWTLKSKFKIIITIIVNALIIIFPFILLFIFKDKIEGIFIGLPLLVSFFMSLIMVIYICIIFILKDIKHHDKQEDNGDQNSPSIVERVSIKTVAKSAATLLIAIIFFVCATFIICCSIADSNREFSFIVSDYNFKLETTNEYEVILSETDDIYYLAKCDIITEDINGKESVKLIVYPDSYSIVKKEDKTIIIRKSFDLVEKR